MERDQLSSIANVCACKQAARASARLALVLVNDALVNDALVNDALALGLSLVCTRGCTLALNRALTLA